MTTTARAATLSSGLHRHRQRTFWPFVGPALVLYVVLLVLPSLGSLVVSFTRWQGLGTELAPNGIANYARLLTSEPFLVAFRNTLLLTLVGGTVVFGITFLAMIVLRTAFGGSLIRSVIFVPYILSPIAIGVAIGFLLNPDGAVNTALRTLGLGGLARAWLSPELIFSMIVLGLIWSVSGFYVALMMASADSIPAELYEASDLAGATRVQQFLHITFPLTRDALATAAVLWVINAIKTFEIVIAFTGTAGTPGIAARTIAVQQYLTITGGNGGVPELGAGAAIGVVLFGVSAMLVLLVRRVLASEVYER